MEEEGEEEEGKRMRMRKGRTRRELRASRE